MTSSIRYEAHTSGACLLAPMLLQLRCDATKLGNGGRTGHIVGAETVITTARSLRRVSLHATAG